MHRGIKRGFAAWPLVPAALLLCALLAGCAHNMNPPIGADPSTPVTPAPGARPFLGGTAWRLVEFQSMSDKIGTVRPDDPAKFTMRLMEDGKVAMRLDCNRAMGEWFIDPAEDGTSGRFEFGPLASTRALCPPPNLDELILSQAGYVRGFLLRDGMLHLSLMADGGIFTWEPLPEEVAWENQPDPALEASLRKAFPDYTQAIVAIGGSTARYIYARMDLNGDSEQEVFVYLLGSIFCGTGGCNLLLFKMNGDDYALLNNFPLSRTPVIASTDRTNGWRDLYKLESGGGSPASYVKFVFDGERYTEERRLPGDAHPDGVRVVSGDFAFTDGAPLEPGP